MTLTIADINRRHDEAMNMYSDYLVTRERSYLISACKLEHEAAEAVLAMDAPEPSRCLILKSAAFFAADVGRLRDVERYLCAALAGEPPAELVDELRRLLIDTVQANVSVSMLRSSAGPRLPEQLG